MVTQMRTIRALNSWIFGKSAVKEYEMVLHRGDREVPATLTVPQSGKRSLPGWIVLHGMTRPGRFGSAVRWHLLEPQFWYQRFRSGKTYISSPNSRCLQSEPA